MLSYVGPYLGKVCKALACRAIVNGRVHLAIDQVQVAIAGVRGVEQVYDIVIVPSGGVTETL